VSSRIFQFLSTRRAKATEAERATKKVTQFGACGQTDVEYRACIDIMN
jgi:hypothetical protein